MSEPLFTYLQQTNSLLCLQCVLPECNEADPRCLYQTAKERKAYWAAYYHLNRDKKIAAVNKRRTALDSEQLKELDRRDYERRKEYFANRYQDNKDRKLAAANERNAARRRVG